MWGPQLVLGCGVKVDVRDLGWKHHKSKMFINLAWFGDVEIWVQISSEKIV